MLSIRTIEDEKRRIKARLEDLRTAEMVDLEERLERLAIAEQVIRDLGGHAAAVPSTGNGAEQPQKRRGRQPGSKNKPKEPGQLVPPTHGSLNDRVLNVVQSLSENGATGATVVNAMRSAGYADRANHIGIALGRLGRAGWIIETDGKWRHRDWVDVPQSDVARETDVEYPMAAAASE